MALEWLKTMFGSTMPAGTSRRVTRVDGDLCAIAAEVAVRELALSVCINMIAGAVGRCEFQTFREGKPVREREYYLWNVEPNINQNSSAFLHELKKRKDIMI